MSNQPLLLKKEIFELAASGVKKSTSRKGKRDIKCGLLTFKMTEDENIQLVVNVTKVDFKPYSQISDAEARKEGYASIGELRDVLTKIYGIINDDELFTFVEFEKI